MYVDQTGFLNTEVRPAVYSLQGIIAWAEGKPADREYDYNDVSGACFLCQYLSEQGENYCNYGQLLSVDLRQQIAQERPWTFGAALERARAALTSQRS